MRIPQLSDVYACVGTGSTLETAVQAANDRFTSWAADVNGWYGDDDVVRVLRVTTTYCTAQQTPGGWHCVMTVGIEFVPAARYGLTVNPDDLDQID